MVDLYTHQRDAVERLHNGAILCGGVGSGKSRTALAYFFEKVCKGYFPEHEGLPVMQAPRDLYIITTAKKRDNLEWEQECIPFCLTTHSENDIYGVRVIVDSWNNIKKYTKVYGAFFIFDEQRLVGSGAWVKAFYQIAKKNQWVLLSATPGDTWSDYIPVFVANGFYKNRTAFNTEHAIYSNYGGYPKLERYVGIRKLLALREKVMVHMAFEKTSSLHHEYIKVEYDRAYYNLIAKRRWDPYKDEPIANASSYCSVLRRVCNTNTTRISKTVQLLQENSKLIIFYNFDYELEILRSLCEGLGLIYAEWNGHKHMEIPRTLRWVYLVQYTAGAEGWNCTETNTILFYSLSYSYKTMVQSAGRIDRLNTPYSDLYCYYLYSDSPIDKAIMRCLKDKKNFNERHFANFGHF